MVGYTSLALLKEGISGVGIIKIIKK